MSDKSVSITASGTSFAATPDSIDLSKGHGDTLKWSNDTTTQISISFPGGSPFSKPQPYVIPAGKTENPGAITGSPATYSYTISASTGVPADPDVVIKP